MKSLKRFKEFITEEKQVGPLYYYTTVADAGRCLKMNKIRSIEDHVHVVRSTQKEFNEHQCRLMLDGDKLSGKYHIVPMQSGEVVCRDSILNLDKYLMKVELWYKNVYGIKKFVINDIPLYSAGEVEEYLKNFTEDVSILNTRG
jgi:hypothetical protein